MKVESITHLAHHPAFLPMLAEAVPAGFPSPAQDYFDEEIDLNSVLMPNRTSMYLARVSGHSMIRAGIYDGDEVIFDKSIEPKDGHIVLAVLDGELTVKRLRVTASGVILTPENPAYPNITVPEFSELNIWGVVVRCLHYVR